jgi:hypothetical protein
MPEHSVLVDSGTPSLNSLGPSAKDSVEDTGPSSPGSSTGQTEGRDHEFYRRGVGPDSLYHCPYEDCDSPPKSLKWEYQ